MFLDDVLTGQRAPERRQAEPRDREDFVEPFKDVGRNTTCFAPQPPRQIFDQLLGTRRIVDIP